MQRTTFLEYNQYRYLKIAGLLVVLAVMAYSLDQHEMVGYGASGLGLLFGILSMLIIVLLVLYGVRKRLPPKTYERRRISTPLSPRSVTADRRERKANWLRHQGITLQGWLSVHVCFGVLLVVLATLHTGFQFESNFHTLTYVLMMAVIVSGFYGIYAYLRFPRLMTDNLDGDTFETLLLKIDDLDKLASDKSLQFSDEVCAIVLKSRQETRIGGNFLQQLLGQNNSTAVRAVQQLKVLGKGLKDDELKSFNDLYSIMVHKENLLTRAWCDIKYRARNEFWLYLHAPLSIAFLVALITHIVVIYFYW